MNFTFNDIFSNPRYLVAIMGVLVFLLIVFLVTLAKLVGEEKTPWKLAGKRGESEAGDLIGHVLYEDDHLFRNVSVEVKKSETELDFVIVNAYGVHIIEVKNYVGTLYGNEDDHDWRKVKITRFGRRYVKMVRNPIKQVKRQVYILAEYLRENDIDVWVSGYALLTENNSPVHNEYVLESLHDIDRALHTEQRQHLSEEQVGKIVSLL